MARPLACYGKLAFTDGGYKTITIPGSAASEGGQLCIGYSESAI